MSHPRAKKIVIFDYGIGNLHSAAQAFTAAGADVTVTKNRLQVMEADGLVVPGVGAFSSVVAGLTAVHGPELIGRRLAGARPVFGICVGMQVLFETGHEGESSTEGLAEWPGSVQKLHAPILPHMGWNQVRTTPESTIFRGVEEEYFYFVHSYAAKTWELDPGPAFKRPAVTWAEYGEDFVAAVENGPLTATQFHPEKSGNAGLRLISNWLHSL